MRKSILIMLLLTVGTYNMIQAQKLEVMTSNKEGWHKIGETTVNFKKDTDEILVIGNNAFSQIKFVVKETPINLISMELNYSKGAPQNIKVNNPVKANGESHSYKVEGGKRKLTKIVFIYKTLPNQKDDKAHVEIWGYKAMKEAK